jgi:hypothetical protein
MAIEELWNILRPYLGETGAYLGVSARNIPQIERQSSLVFRYLSRFGPRAENPRVGGSIPPLATTKSKI